MQGPSQLTPAPSRSQDSEARLDRLRHNASKKAKSRRKDEDEGEKALDRQLRGDKGESHPGERGEAHMGGSEIVRPAGWKGKGREMEREHGPEPIREGEVRHINFWSEHEAVVSP